MFYNSELNESIAANSHLKDENTLLKAQMSAKPAERTDTSQDTHQLAQYHAKVQELTAEVSRLTNELRISQEAQKTSRQELEKMSKDQDDLLVLLADQDMKLNEYKMRLVSLGQMVEEDLPAGSDTLT